MPSQLHEALILLFRNRPELCALELVRYCAQRDAQRRGADAPVRTRREVGHERLGNAAQPCAAHHSPQAFQC
jgi:hypothetical protein